MKLLKFNIGAKVLLPVKIAFFLSILILLVVSGYFQNKQYVHETSTLINFSKQNIEKNIEILSDIAMQKAMEYSQRKKVVDIYHLYYATGNIDSTSHLLKQYVNEADKRVSKITNYTHKTHFHLPPARSFCRVFSNQYGDDLHSFRQSILKVFETHTPQKGIEIGRAGLVIRGLSPILSETGEYLGSVEVFYNLNDLISMSTLTKDVELGILVYLTKYDNIIKLTQSKEKEAYEKLNSKIILLDKSSNNLSVNLVKESQLLQSLDNKQVYEADSLLFAVFPIKDIGNNDIGFGLCQVNISEYQKNMLNLQITIGTLVLLLLIISFFTILLVVRKLITHQVNEAGSALKNLSEGKVNKELSIKGEDEISQMKKALNSLNSRMLELTDFANSIGAGNFSVEFTPHSKDDVLGNALLEMRKGLVQAERNARQIAIEEKQRNWATSGIASFAEILRSTHTDIKEFSENIIIHLVRYIEAEQGAMYVVNDENAGQFFIELTAAFASDRKLSLHIRYDVDEGLIGACYQEADTIFLTEIPQEYVKIVSGLGESKPSCLLIVPLKHNNVVYGIVELASYNVLDTYKINFVERMGETIAVALFNFKINMRTNKLLEKARKEYN